MSIFNRYGPCRGFTFFKWNQWRAEIWYIPSGYTIVEHRHPEEDVELMYLMGSTEFCRRDIRTNVVESAPVKWPSNMFKCYGVKHYHTHFFTVGKWPLIFINFQRFLNGTKPKSAAIDFLVTEIK